MSTQDIEAVLIKEIAAIISADPSDVDNETPLHDMGVDSLSFVELLVVIEKKFNVNLMESGLKKEDFQTIRALSLCISKAR